VEDQWWLRAAWFQECREGDKDKVRPRGRDAREKNDNYQRKGFKKQERTDNNET
jgi:hypothetical protein